MDAMTAEDYLRGIPFAVASIAELCTEPGSYAHEVARRVSQAVRCDVEKALAMLADKRE